MVILADHNIEKISFRNFNFSAVQAKKLHKEVVYQSRLTPPRPLHPIANRVKNT